MSEPGRRLAWLVGGVVAVLIATQAPASANPFPNNADLTVADNALHTYCFTTSFTTDPAVGDYAMAVLHDTTDMDQLFPTTPATCTFMETDIWWFDFNHPAGTRGTRLCWDEVPAGICTSSDLKLDFPELDLGSFDWEDRRKTAVHELGHSIGLGHDTISAMMSGQVPDASITWRRFSAHDISHINAHY